MDESTFIVTAYCVAGFLLACLFLMTWLRARHVRAQLAARERHEA